MKKSLSNQSKRPFVHYVFGIAVIGIVIAVCATYAFDAIEVVKQKLSDKDRLEVKMVQITKDLSALKNQDQYKINQKLNANIHSIESTYSVTVAAYEELLKLKEISRDTKKFDDAFTNILTLLSKQNYATAASELTTFVTASTFTIPQNVPASNTPPGSGFSQQTVNVDGSSYLVSIVAGDLGSTRVLVDTASGGDCKNDCPVLPLSDYVSRNGAYAGINGSYFCPADYPSCADKKNSFDTLLMNKNKVYFNSDNNVYSTVPAVIFLGGSVRFVGRSLDWGRDTGIDSMIANQPLLVSGGTVAFGGDGDPKKGSKGSRSFVANKGNTVYIGVMYNVTVAEGALVMKALGMDNALNLDSGGSTALWAGGYKAGPGRNIPNAILFVRK
jgi:tellurite resistance protein